MTSRTVQLLNFTLNTKLCHSWSLNLQQNRYIPTFTVLLNWFKQQLKPPARNLIRNDWIQAKPRLTNQCSRLIVWIWKCSVFGWWTRVQSWGFQGNGSQKVRSMSSFLFSTLLRLCVKKLTRASRLRSRAAQMCQQNKMGLVKWRRGCQQSWVRARTKETG